MSQSGSGVRGDLGLRNRKWSTAKIVAAVSLLLIVVLAPVACTMEWGGKSESTASSTAAPTDSSAGSGGSDAGVQTTLTTSTPPSVNVVDTGAGLASPAKAVAEVLGPSVVNIATSGTQDNPGGFGPQQYDYAYEGSGVIYSSDGMIITNKHVVSDDFGDPAEELVVTLATGEKLSGTIVGSDPLTDLAVVKVETDMSLPAATFVTEDPEVGEYAVAIGSPLGYENSVSLGIVSGLGRSIEQIPGIEGVAYNNLIQTDAPISPGNSGGALANASGQVVGINVAYEPPVTGAVSIGFAIPSVVVTQVADQIIATGKATHAYLGVSTQTVTPELRDRFNLSRDSGILVAEVTPGGPAMKAGMLQGDIIINIDGEDMVESSDVLMAIRDRLPGEQVEVTVDRDGTTMVINATLEERPAGF